MLYALSWFVVFGLIAIWSLAIWALHFFAAWSVSSVGALAGRAESVEGVFAPGWITAWIPPEVLLALKSLLSALTPAMDSALIHAPSWAGGLSAALWLLWGIGAVILLVLGGVLHGLIAMFRRRAFLPAARTSEPVASSRVLAAHVRS